MFLLVFGLVAAFTLPTELGREQLNSMPVSSIAGLGPAGSEKVFGTVSPGQSTVIVVFGYTDNHGNRATGRHVENFWVNDSSGRALVQMGSNTSTSPTIVSGGDPYPSVGVATGFQYRSGDSISVIGKVVRLGNETILQATAVAPTPTTFFRPPSTPDTVFFGVPLSAASIAVAAGVLLTRSRLRLHERNAPMWAAKRPKELAAPPRSDGITWIDNPYPRRLRWMALALNSAFVAFVAIFLVVVVSPITFPDPVYYGVLFTAPIALIFTGVYGLASYFGWRGGVTRLGASPSGVYLDYHRPPKNARTFLAWVDVREMEAPLALNRRAAKLDTPLGSELVGGLSPEVIVFLRSQFESARVPYRDRSTPIRPSLESLLGTGAPAAVSGTVWTRNPLRPRWIRQGAFVMALEIPAFAAFLVFFERFGINRGEALFFFPLLFGAQWAYQGAIAVREIGISSFAFSLRERKGERSIPWAEIAEMTPNARGLRYKTVTGFAEAIGGLDVTAVRAIVDGLNRARGLRSTGSASPVPPPEGAWLANPVHGAARNLLLLALAPPIGVIGVSLAWLLVAPLSAIALLGVVLPFVALVFAIFPWLLFRLSPKRIAVTSDAVFVDYGGRRLDPSLFEVLPLSLIASATTVGGSATKTVAPAGFLGTASTPISLRTVTGVNIGIGPVSPGVARAFAGRLRPEQLRGWKLAP